MNVARYLTALFLLSIAVAVCLGDTPGIKPNACPTSPSQQFAKAISGTGVLTCQVPAGATGITSINAQTQASQTLVVGTSGVDFAISSAIGVHTFNLPTASAGSRGALSSADWTTFNSKQAAGNYITALTGDVTAAGPGSSTATIAANAVSNAKLAQVATATFKGRTTAGTGAVEDLNATQATALLNTFTTSAKGLVPAPTAVNGYYLKDDGTWAAVAGGGVTTVGAFSGSSQTNGASISGSNITFGPADGTNPGMVSTGTQTIAGAKTFSNNIAITPTSSYAEVSNATNGSKLSLGNQGGQASVNFCPLGTCGNNSSLSVWSYDGTPALGNGGPFMSIHPVLLFQRQGSDTPSGSNIRSLSNFNGGNSLSDQNWLGGEWSTFQRVAPWYGAALNFIAMGFEHFDTAPTVLKGGITVETGDPLTLDADSVNFVHKATPANPAAGSTAFYFKSDNLPYRKTPAGAEFPIGDVTSTATPTINDVGYRPAPLYADDTGKVITALGSDTIFSPGFSIATNGRAMRLGQYNFQESGQVNYLGQAYFTLGGNYFQLHRPIGFIDAAYNIGAIGLSSTPTIYPAGGFYGSSLLLGYSATETSPVITPGEINVKTGTPLRINAPAGVQIGNPANAPNFTLGLQASASATAIYQQFTIPTTTGTASTDGTIAGLATDGSFYLIQQESARIIGLNSTGGITLVGGTSGAGNGIVFLNDNGTSGNVTTLAARTQSNWYTPRSTSNATPTVIYSDSNFSDPQSVLVTAKCSTIENGGPGFMAGYVRRALVSFDSGAPGVIGAVQDAFTAEQNAGMDLTIAYTAGALELVATGVAATAIQWRCSVDYQTFAPGGL